MARRRESITGFGGLSMVRNPTRKEGVKSRKRRGRPDMTRHEYYFG